MNKVDVARVLSILEVAYPNAYRDMDDTKKMAVSVLWERRFSSLPAELVFSAVEELVGKSKFPPSVADVAEHLVGMYWDNLLYFSGMKHGTILLSEADKKWVLFVNNSLESFARNTDAPSLPTADETKLLR